jgi:hypothetical protein
MNTLLQLAQSSYDYTYTTTTSSNLTPEQSSALAAGIIVFYIITFAVAYVLNGILLGRIFKKAGIASWIAWVPFYNVWKMLEIGGQPGFWAVLAILPIVNIVSVVYLLIAEYNIGLKLGKSSTFVLFAIFLPIVWLIWLAVDKSVWNNTLGAPSKAAEHTGAKPTA